MIQPTPSFKDNLAQLPTIDGLARIDLVDVTGTVRAVIENQPGKKGSLAVYQYLFQCFGALNADAAAHGLKIFAEHTLDAQDHPGAHPNIDRLFDIVATGETLQIELIRAEA